MRLLITTDTVGGIWTYTRELVQGLLAADTSVTLLTLGRTMSEDQFAWCASICNRFGSLFTLVPTAYRLEWMEESGDDVLASRQCVASLIKTHNPDLFHTNQFAFASMTVAIPKLLVAHSDVIGWWRVVKGSAAPASAWFTKYRHLVSNGILGADALVAPTQWMMNQVCSIYGEPAKTRVIANGRSPSLFRADQPKLLQAVSLGRLWDEGKHVALLQRVRSKVPLVIAGEVQAPSGSLPTQASFHAMHEDERDRPTRLQMMGLLAEAKVRKLLESSAIYVATSRYEPFGLAPVEAALAGCAILANDIPSFHEVWGDAALYYKRDCAISLGKVLDALSSHPDYLSAMAARARQHALAHFGAARMVSDYLELYRELVNCKVAAYA